jgi:hypothetical protein
VHFEHEHDFAGSAVRVAEIMSDASFQTGLDLPDLSRPEVIGAEADGDQRLLKLRYEYIGQLDSIAQKVVGGRTLTWVQELRIDVERGGGTLAFSADGDAGRVHGTATVTITATGDASCHRHIAGDFRIRIPGIGGTAERKIVPGLVRRLGVEADAVAVELERV